MKLQILGLFWKILGDFPAESKVLFTFVSKLSFFSKVFKVGFEIKVVLRFLRFLRLRGNPEILNLRKIPQKFQVLNSSIGSFC